MGNKYYSPSALTADTHVSAEQYHVIQVFTPFKLSCGSLRLKSFILFLPVLYWFKIFIIKKALFYTLNLSKNLCLGILRILFPHPLL